MSTDGSPDYIVRAKIVATDATGPGAKEAERSIDRVLDKTDRLGLSMGRVFTFLGGAAGLGAVAKGFVSINSQIQDAQNGLATLYTAMTGTDISKTVRIAAADVRGLRADAAAGVGELQDYLRGYQSILAAGLAAGASTGSIRTLNRNAIAAAGALGRPLEQAGFDVQQALTAGAHQRTTPIVEAALAAIQMTDTAFNRLNPAKKIETLNRAFASFGPGVELMGRSWTAQFSTLEDNIKTVVGTVGKPLFDRWSDQLRTVNDWLARNKDYVADIAERWGTRLVKVWDTLIARAGTYAAILAAAKVAPMVVGGVQSATAAVGAYSARVGLGAALADPLGISAGLGVTGATAGLFGEGGLIAGLGASLAAVAVPAAATAAVFASLALVGDGMWESMKRNTDAFQTFTAESDKLAPAIDGLAEKFAPLVDLFDRMATAVGDAAFYGLSSFVDRLVEQANNVSLGLALAGGGIEGFQAERARQFYAAHPVNGSADDLAASLGFDRRGDSTDTLNVPKNVTNINGPITITMKAEINADPDRTMIAVGLGLDRIRTAALQSRRIPGLSGA